MSQAKSEGSSQRNAIEVEKEPQRANAAEIHASNVQAQIDLQPLLPRLYASSGLGEIGLDRTAYRIANDGRTYIEVDRVSVASFNGIQAKLLAVSGVATIEGRAKQVRALELLVSQVAKSLKPLCYPCADRLPPELEKTLGEYLDVSGCERMWITPIASHRPEQDEDCVPAKVVECIGAVISENFTNDRSAAVPSRIEMFMRHAEIAFRNASIIEHMPLRRWSLALQRVSVTYRSMHFRMVVVLLGWVTGTLAAFTIPTDFNIEAQGTLQPRNLRHIYAPASGEIIQLNAQYEDNVEIGDTLLVIRSRELELRKQELLTERGVTLEKLRGIEAARLREHKSNSADSASGIELSASELELREVLLSQNNQLAVLKEMLDTLEVKSPTVGSVISWNPLESLERRPVQQGQKLMSIATLDGQGFLELHVLDEDIRHVVEASATLPHKLKVTFSIASDPGRKHSAEVEKIGTIVELGSHRGASVQVAASIGVGEMENAAPGASVNARIHCGRASLGYVWTRRLWDFLLLHLT